ncbi:tol-pal system protein YbgF [Algiphilus sp.]|uniref:tol-pal system protein YbgF n=1 Tax=Algiphilus sp. TaxID=1872431 RepID=UPI0025C081B4|nr:tol-pal system protein YbgF [Algiphilus sp.]
MQRAILPGHWLIRTGTATLVAVLVSGCAGFGGPINGEGEISPEERRLRDIEAQLDQTARRVDNMSQAQLSQGSTALADEMRTMRGKVEELRYQLDRMEQRSQRQLQDLERRVSNLERGGGYRSSEDSVDTGGNSVVAPGLGADGGGDQPPPQRDPDEEKAYLAAFDLLKQGEYADAILGFENVVKNWPNGRYADTALYWAGESYYVQRDYQKALTKFRTLLEEHPRSKRRPDALLKAGFALEELGKPQEAAGMFRTIVEEHGDSSAANLARQRLERQ